MCIRDRDVAPGRLSAYAGKVVKSLVEAGRPPNLPAPRIPNRPSHVDHRAVQCAGRRRPRADLRRRPPGSIRRRLVAGVPNVSGPRPRCRNLRKSAQIFYANLGESTAEKQSSSFEPPLRCTMPVVAQAPPRPGFERSPITNLSHHELQNRQPTSLDAKRTTVLYCVQAAHLAWVRAWAAPTHARAGLPVIHTRCWIPASQ